jgi:hypothetical protein
LAAVRQAVPVPALVWRLLFPVGRPGTHEPCHYLLAQP